jgi:hypothetical protein
MNSHRAKIFPVWKKIILSKENPEQGIDLNMYFELSNAEDDHARGSDWKSWRQQLL